MNVVQIPEYEDQSETVFKSLLVFFIYMFIEWMKMHVSSSAARSDSFLIEVKKKVDLKF